MNGAQTPGLGGQTEGKWVRHWWDRMASAVGRALPKCVQAGQQDGETVQEKYEISPIFGVF